MIFAPHTYSAHPTIVTKARKEGRNKLRELTMKKTEAKLVDELCASWFVKKDWRGTYTLRRTRKF
jgi:hypothetical protein